MLLNVRILNNAEIVKLVDVYFTDKNCDKKKGGCILNKIIPFMYLYLALQG